MAEQIINKRVKFPKGKQRLFIKQIADKLNLGKDELSKIFNIKKRTLSDWYREKSTMSYAATSYLFKNYNIPFPVEAKVLPQFWHIHKAAKQGALIRNKIYGNPGTPEGRKKGGLTTMRKFISNPNLAQKLKVKIRKDIDYPKKCTHLAELLGIVLGDGNLMDYYLRITFNRDSDIKYAFFVKRLLKELFNISSVIIPHNSDKSSDVVIYSRNLVEFLQRAGLKKGNKVKNKADIPSWIKQNRSFQISCLRGLADTDGSFYNYNHRVKSYQYSNFAFCFTNRSNNLLRSVFDILKANNFNPVIAKERVYLYKIKDIERYFKIVNSHNYKHIQKYRVFIKGGE